MNDAHVELGSAPPFGRGSSHTSSVKLPLAWFRRRKTWIAGVVTFIVVCAYVWMHPIADVPYKWGTSTQATDADLTHLLQHIPGAVPGKYMPSHAHEDDYGRHGEPYPSKEDLLTVLIEDLKDPLFNVDDSIWTEWRHWVSSEGSLPPDAHLQFIKKLKALDHGDTADVQLYLEHPNQWEEKHLHMSPITVFSKSYCPYSAGAKALLQRFNAHFRAYEVDLRGTSHIYVAYSHHDRRCKFDPATALGPYRSSDVPEGNQGIETFGAYKAAFLWRLTLDRADLTRSMNWKRPTACTLFLTRLAHYSTNIA